MFFLQQDLSCLSILVTWTLVIARSELKTKLLHFIYYYNDNENDKDDEVNDGHVITMVITMRTTESLVHTTNILDNNGALD